MEVIAFVGASGTGKSHRALVVAHENQVECIIDDGILIHRNRIVAGFSAKKEESRLKAVRRAIFQDPVQVASVQQALAEIQPQKLLVLGTSEKMVKQITRALKISTPSRYIHIEEVATPKDIEKAQYARLKEGKHIIPVPTMELKPHFKGYLIDPIKSFWRRAKLKKGAEDTQDFEKSVIRPVFSYYGKLTFSDEVIAALINNSIQKVSGVAHTDDIRIKKSPKGSNGLFLDMEVTLWKGCVVKDVMKEVHHAISQEIEYMTGMNLERVSIEVECIIPRKKGMASQGVSRT